MKWRVDYSRDAEKFAESQNIRADVGEQLKRFLRLRIIFEIDKTDQVLFVDRIDFRGDVYK